MATTQNSYTGDGSTVLFSFTFPYLNTSDIKVSVDDVLTTAYSLANATQIQFNSAPANGTSIKIYRDTTADDLVATFYPGSAIRSQDLNNNFIQNLYVTQESQNRTTEANTTADAAATDAANAVSTANAASAAATNAVSDASAAVATANAASSTANTALSTANSASATATSAASDAAAAVSTANTASSNINAAVTTANNAASDASTALSTANSAAADAATAISTANTADTNASTALSTSNTAISNSSSAVTTANSADVKADQAIAAVANALLFSVVANVAAIPASPADGDAIEVTNSTSIQNFSPLSGIPYGFVGDSGLSVRIRYDSNTASWIWLQYFPNDPDNRYSIVELIDGGNFTNGSSIVNGNKTLDGGSF